MTNSFHYKNSQFNLKPNSFNENYLVFDIETNGLYDEATELFCVAIHDVVRNETIGYGPGSIDRAIDRLASATCLIGHNIIFYDLPVLKKLLDFNTTSHVIDTLICTRLIWPKEKLQEVDTDHYQNVPPKLRGSASLKAWGYRLGNFKDNFTDFSAFTPEMLEYCKQDCNVTTSLYHLITTDPIKASALRLEHDFAQAINKQIRSGFPFDTNQCFNFVDELEARKKIVETELTTKAFPPIQHEEIVTPKASNKTKGIIKGVPYTKVTVEHFNPASRQQTVRRLQDKYGWVPEATTEKGNPILNDDVLSQLPYPEAKLLAEYQLLKKRLGQIKDGDNAWLKLVGDDGKMHGDLITNGCITGRASHRTPNMGQIPAVYSPYGDKCRSLFGPPPGRILLGADAKALELRCLAGYLALWDGGEYGEVVTDDSQDIHTYNQQRFGVTTRDISKRLLYAVLYGAGFIKAGTIVDPKEKNPDKLKQLGREAIMGFMEGVPALQKLKATLKSNLEKRGHLIGLDRRPLYCRSEFKALNVLLQSAGAIIMKQVVVNLHQLTANTQLTYGSDWEQHAMIHDEVQLSVQPDLVQTIKPLVLESFLKAGTFYDFKCLIEGDIKTGANWALTH
tara:strand:+ start:6679 stop:8538 length:1860 start_codon:yes stop_codon:yes gene_type:complete